jgi:hypothetical protein
MKNSAAAVFRPKSEATLLYKCYGMTNRDIILINMYEDFFCYSTSFAIINILNYAGFLLYINAKEKSKEISRSFGVQNG